MVAVFSSVVSSSIAFSVVDVVALVSTPIDSSSIVSFSKLSSRSRVLTVLDAVEGCARHDVPDPYGGTIDDYLDVRDDIAYAIPSIVQYLKNELKKA